ncbi:MAG: DUF2911 domain-containing protein [Bacteroidota bacterium]
MTSRLLLAALALLLALPVAAQHDHAEAAAGEAETFVVEGFRLDPADPPPGSAVGRAGARLPGGGYLHVTYGKPYARGRQIFGGLVGYDMVWSTGAHRATELVVTVPVTVGGEDLEPGVYSLFTTPRPDRWTLHLNSVLGMHLADEYDPANDVLTADAAPEALDETVEAFVIDFVPEGEGVDLRIQWDRTAARIPIRPR